MVPPQVDLLDKAVELILAGPEMHIIQKKQWKSLD